MYFILFFSTFLLINSHVNLCKKCKYYIPSCSQPLSKCKKFLRNKYYTNSTDYEYCFLAREMKHLCGESGKSFVEKKVETDVENDKLKVEEILSSFHE